ncbi:unnamed protein product [Urochloa humidicola]
MEGHLALRESPKLRRITCSLSSGEGRRPGAAARRGAARNTRARRWRCGCWRTPRPPADWYLCDAERMGFEGAVSAVMATNELRAGQIYFVLPAGVRRRGLSREEVAAVAVRASAALSRAAANRSGAGGRRRRGAVARLVFAPPEEKVQDVEQTFAATHKAAGFCRWEGRGARCGRTRQRGVAVGVSCGRGGGGRGRERGAAAGAAAGGPAAGGGGNEGRRG